MNDGDDGFIHVEVADGGSLRRAALEIRRQVFVVEQGIDARLEFDASDEEADHLLALRAGQPVGTLRVRWQPELGARVLKIERVAVLAVARGCGIGRRLIDHAVAIAGAGHAVAVRLHAQTVAVPFYQRQGFEVEGEPFVEDGLPHVAMRRTL